MVAFLGSGGRSPPAGRVDQSSVRQRCYYPLAEVRGPPTAAMPWCRIYAEGALLSVGMTAGTPSCFKVFLAPDRFPSLRRLANGFGQGASTRLVLGTRGLKRGPEFPPRIARSRGIIARVLSGLGVPPKDRLFCGGCVSVVVITFEHTTE